jgi:origin recognition complex subunit 3
MENYRKVYSFNLLFLFLCRTLNVSSAFQLLNHLLMLISQETSSLPIVSNQSVHFSLSLVQAIQDLHNYLNDHVNTTDHQRANDADNDDERDGSHNRRDLKSSTDFLSCSISLSNSSSFHSLMDRFRSSLEEHFQRHLVCYHWVPLHEVILFNDHHQLEQALHPQLRSSIHMALTEPQSILQCHCCNASSSSSSISSPSPSRSDISLLYNLYHEFGRMINLYDWYMAFASLASPSSSSTDTRQLRPSEKRRKLITSESSPTDAINMSLLARFIRSISELQIIGLIKPTRRKTDHVLRLTWT